TTLLTVLLTGCATKSGDPSSAPVEIPSIAPFDAAQGRPAYAVETAPTTQPDLADRATPAQAHWDAVARILDRTGVATAPAYTVTTPAEDADCTIEGKGLPIQAGSASVVHFYRCPCGKTVLVGQFCVADYELNDVVDELRKAHIEVASISAMLLHTRTNPQI